MQSRVLKRFARFESDRTFRESVISLMFFMCNNKLDCFFLHEMLLITDSFFIKSNLQEPLKNVQDLGLENIFSVTIKRLLTSIFFFFF